MMERKQHAMMKAFSSLKWNNNYSALKRHGTLHHSVNNPYKTHTCNKSFLATVNLSCMACLHPLANILHWLKRVRILFIYLFIDFLQMLFAHYVISGVFCFENDVYKSLKKL